MAILRKVQESPVYQGADEQIAYQLTTTPWGSSPTSTSAAIFKSTGGLHSLVTSTCLSTSVCSVTGDVITTGSVKSLTPGETYRLEIKFTAGENIWEPYCEIIGEF